MQPETVLIRDLHENGMGFAALASGRVILVPGALPGETWSVGALLEPAGGKGLAVASEVSCLTPVPSRIEPRCPVFGDCGGCQLQHWSYAAELDWKRQLVADKLQRLGGLDLRPEDLPPVIGGGEAAVLELQGAVSVAVVGTETSEADANYRNKVTWQPSSEQPLRLGFYAHDSHRVVPDDHCRLLAPPLLALQAALEALWAEMPDLAQKLQTNLAQVLGRAADQDLLLAFHLNNDEALSALQQELEKARFFEELAKRLKAAGCTLRSAHLARPERHYWQYHLVFGEADLTTKLGKTRYHYGAASFFQINEALCAAVLDWAAERLQPQPRIIDIYGGIGTLGIGLASRWSEQGAPAKARLEGCEIVAEAVRFAQENARLNALEATYRRGDAGRFFLEPEGLQESLVIVDPPRNGLDKALRKRLVENPAAELFYLSCNPATLARDLAELKSAYQITALQPFDFFPRTTKVECAAILKGR